MLEAANSYVDCATTELLNDDVFSDSFQSESVKFAARFRPVFLPLSLSSSSSPHTHTHS